MTSCLKRMTAAALLLGTFGVQAQAKEIDASAQVWQKTYYVEGRNVFCADANGQRVPLLCYDGSIYLPLRTAGEWMGKNVGWDGATQTVTLSGSVEPVFRVDTDRSGFAETSASVAVWPDISVVVDGQKQELKAADGGRVYPLVYRETTYLPLRAIGELMGREVTWVSPTAGKEFVYIRTPLTSAQEAEAKDFIKQAAALEQEIQEKGKALTGLADSAPSADALEKLAALTASIQQMRDLDVPSAAVMQDGCRMLREELDRMLSTAQKAETLLKASATVEKANDYLAERSADSGVANRYTLEGAHLPGPMVRLYQVLYQNGTGDYHS